MSAMAKASVVVCEGQALPRRGLGPFGRNPIFVAGHSSSSQATHWNSVCCIRKKQTVIRRVASGGKPSTGKPVREADLPWPWEQTTAVSTRRSKVCFHWHKKESSDESFIFEACPVCLKAWFGRGREGESDCAGALNARQKYLQPGLWLSTPVCW